MEAHQLNSCRPVMRVRWCCTDLDDHLAGVCQHLAAEPLADEAADRLQRHQVVRVAGYLQDQRQSLHAGHKVRTVDCRTADRGDRQRSVGLQRQYL